MQKNIEDCYWAYCCQRGGAPAMAATLGHVNYSAFTIPSAARLQDWERIRSTTWLSMRQGNVYVTAATAMNETPRSPTRSPDHLQARRQPRSTPIFRQRLYDGRRLASNLPAASPGGGRRRRKGVRPCRTGLEISWAITRWNHKILQIDSTAMSTVVLLTRGLVINGCNTARATLPSQGRHSINGTGTVGGDGHVYWTMSGAEQFWKYHLLLAIQRWQRIQAVQKSPRQPVRNRTTAGRNSHRYVFDLQYVEDGWFARGHRQWR